MQERKIFTLTKSEIDEFQQTTGFKKPEIEYLLKIYTQIINKEQSQSMITIKGFCQFIGLPENSKFIQNLFTAFDLNEDQKLNFRELVVSLDSYKNGTFKDVIKLIFRIFSKNEKSIERNQCYILLKSITELFPEIKIPEKSITTLIDNCFFMEKFEGENIDKLKLKYKCSLIEEEVDNSQGNIDLPIRSEISKESDNSKTPVVELEVNTPGIYSKIPNIGDSGHSGNKSLENEDDCHKYDKISIDRLIELIFPSAYLFE